MFRKFAIAAAATAAIVTAGIAAAPQQAEAKTVVNLGIGVGLPGYYGGPYGGYYAPGYYYGPAPVYYAPRYRVRCHRHHRRVRVWSPRRGRYVWRTIRGPRHCHRHRVW